MQIVPSEHEYNSRTLMLAGGEHISETRLVNTLLASGTFAHRLQVEEEIKWIFNVLELLLQRIAMRNENLAQAA